MKKMLVSMMALAMVASVGSTAGPSCVWAAEANVSGYRTVKTVDGKANFGRGTASITVSGNAGQSLQGKRFRLYKLFDAENALGGESIEYTLNAEYAHSVKAVVGELIGKSPSNLTEYEVIDYIQSLNYHKAEGAFVDQTLEGRYSSLRYFVERVRNQFKVDQVRADVVEIKSLRQATQFEITGLDFGYYITDEESDVVGQHSSSSLCMVNTANPNTTIRIKSDYPRITKKIQEDDNQREIGNSGWNDLADYEIGQTVPYQYESQIPNINGYHTYYYAWHDKMDPALTFQKDSVQIQITSPDNQQVKYVVNPDEYQVKTDCTDGDTFQIIISDIKSIIDREFPNQNGNGENKYGQTVRVTYNATLNEQAAKDTGRPGFENDVRLEFSNDPDSDGQNKTGYTPWDTVVCFTYKLDVLKSNQFGKTLQNAKFRLYADENLTEEVYVKKLGQGYCVMNRDMCKGNAPSEAVYMNSGTDGKIAVYGLDSGTYYLKETEAPVGYRLLKDPIVLQVNATFCKDRNSYVKGDGATDAALVKLESIAHVKSFWDGLFHEQDTVLETDVNEGNVNITVVNRTGKKLPATGSGMIFLVIGAGVLCLITPIVIMNRKKQEKNEKTRH